mgnify:FL=1
MMRDGQVCLWAGGWSGVTERMGCDSDKKWHTVACVMVECLQLLNARGDAAAFVGAFSLI